MSNNVMKEKWQAMITECAGDNQDFFSGKKIVFRLLMSILVMRIIVSGLEAAFIIANGYQFSSQLVLRMILNILVVLAFFNQIYFAGNKPFVYLGIIGAIASFVMSFINGSFSYFNKGDKIYDASIIFFILMVIQQVGGMVFVSLNKKCSLYMGIITDARKKFQEIIKTAK